MKIGIARLRSRTRYVKPLEHILDSWFYLLDRYIKDNPQNEYAYYNITFDDTMPKRKHEEMVGCDYILIPSENEFHYQTKNYIHTLQKKKSDEYLRVLESVLPEGQKIILLTSDKGDDIALYENRVFFKKFNYQQIDESVFRYGLHSLKYHFIKERYTYNHNTKIYDFVYWGTSKRKDPNNNNTTDDRWKVLYDIKQDDRFKSFFIGRFDKFRPDLKFQLDFTKALEHIRKGKATLCFNWLDSKTHTARYHEALANGLIPFTWKQYDEDRELIKSNFQVCKNTRDIKQKLDLLKTFGEKLYSQIRRDYERDLPSKNEQYDRFKELFNPVLEGYVV